MLPFSSCLRLRIQTEWNFISGFPSLNKWTTYSKYWRCKLQCRYLPWTCLKLFCFSNIFKPFSINYVNIRFILLYNLHVLYFSFVDFFIVIFVCLCWILPFSFHSVKCILIEGTVGRELCDSATVRTSKGVLCQRYTTNCLYFVEGYVKYTYYLLFSSAVDKNALKWDTDSEFRSNFDPVLGSPVCYKF